MPRYSQLLCFVNYMKISFKVNSLNDYRILQIDLNSFVIWTFTLELILNIGKYRSMLFTRGRPSITFYYSTNSYVLLPIDNCMRWFWLYIYFNSLSLYLQWNNATNHWNKWVSLKVYPVSSCYLHAIYLFEIILLCMCYY